MKKIFALVGMLALLTFPISTMAQRWQMGMHQGMGYGPSWMGGWASRLNLSNEQMQKLEALHEKYLKETRLRVAVPLVVFVLGDVVLGDVPLRN